MQASYYSIDDMQVLALKNAMEARRKIQKAIFGIPQDFQAKTYLSGQYQRNYLEMVKNTLPQQDSFLINLFLDYFQQESHVSLSAKQEALNQVWEDNPYIIKNAGALSEFHLKSQQVAQDALAIDDKKSEERKIMRQNLGDRVQKITEEEWEELQRNNPTFQQLNAKIQQQITPSDQDVRDLAESTTRNFIQLAQDICQNLEMALQQSRASVSPSSIAIKREARMNTTEQPAPFRAHPI